MRKEVKKGYENGQYAQVYARDSNKLDSLASFLIGKLLSKVSNNAKILDLGCGTGLPFDGYLVEKGCSVVGIDITEKHIALAKKNVPSAKFICGDFFSKEITSKYDAIVSFYAIFHIPRAEHEKLLEYMHSLLNPKGLILISLGAENMVCHKENNFVGQPMLWSSYNIEKNKEIVGNAGFKILLAIEEHSEEHHLWILARKK